MISLLIIEKGTPVECIVNYSLCLRRKLTICKRKIIVFYVSKNLKEIILSSRSIREMCQKIKSFKNNVKINQSEKKSKIK